MIEMNNMLIIGGNARNIGKTTLACRIIEQFSVKQKNIGLKVITHRKGDERFHGEKENELMLDYIITEEKKENIQKDTARMLKSGALRVYIIRTKEIHLEKALNEFFQKVNPSSIFVCESNSLNNHVNPGVYFMVRSRNMINEKSSAIEAEKRADRIIDTEGNPDKIKEIELNLDLSHKGWFYKKLI